MNAEVLGVPGERSIKISITGTSRGKKLGPLVGTGCNEDLWRAGQPKVGKWV